MRIFRVFLGVIFFLLLIFTIFGFSVDYLVGLIFAFLTIVVLIVIIFTTKTPKKTYPKGFGVNHLKETNSPRHEHATLGMGTGKKILLIAIITVVGFFVAGFGGIGLYSVLYPEEYADWSARLDREIEQDEALETQKRLAEQAQKEKQQEITQIKTSTALPDSCRGVNSMELDIYPTGKQCFSALNNRVEEWCLSQSKDCVTQFYLKLADTCADPILSSVDVCLMYTFKELYPKLIP